MDVNKLLGPLDAAFILALVVITEMVKRALPESYWRAVPLIPLALGLGAGFVMAGEASNWQAVTKTAILYAGGASLAYELGRSTVLGKGGPAK
jgi:hypothetical protein